MKTAIVHDWLTGMRGGEKVLASICALFPDADLYTLFHFPGTVSEQIEHMNIRTSFLQSLPFTKNYYRYYLSLFPAAVESFDLSGYELILSTSHCVAKGVNRPRGALHISYLHTPMRYIWDLYDAYFGPGKSSPPVRVAMKMFKPYLRRWDVCSSGRVTHFLANSGHVAERIERIYRREAEVIYPPVDVDFFTPLDNPGEGEGYLIVSALVPYKNIDLAVAAFNKSKLPLTIVGRGPEEAVLRAKAGPTVRFLGWLEGKELREAYRRCRALIFPGEEDFGITAVEAQACGRPVIALARGGVSESVINGITGLFFEEPLTKSLTGIIDKFAKTSFNYKDIRSNAVRFSEKRFRQAYNAFIRKCLDDKTFR